MDIEDAAKCAKETVYGEKMSNLDKIRQLPNSHSSKANTSTVKSKNSSAKRKSHQDFPHGTCGRCGSTTHVGKDCKFRNAECRLCKKTGHIENVCLQKQNSGVSRIETLSHVTKTGTAPQLGLEVHIRNKTIDFEIDTGSSANFISSEFGTELEDPLSKKYRKRINRLQITSCQFWTLSILISKAVIPALFQSSSSWQMSQI